MAIKSATITLGRLLEASLHIPGLPLSNVLSTKSSSGVTNRLQKATNRGWISAEQCTALKELLTNRDNVHIKKLRGIRELDLYKVEHVNAPHEAVLALMSKLKAWHANGQPN
jgi:hypothetical protein